MAAPIEEIGNLNLGDKRDDKTTSELNKTCSEVIKEAVDKLYDFRDHYFEYHSVSEASKKVADIANELSKTLSILEINKEKCEKEDRAYYLLMLGKALNVTSDFNQTAMDALSKAVKLNFKLIDAWNELGICYWKKGDMQGAKNCFEGALQRVPNKISYRSLSMVLRQIGGTRDEKQNYVLTSILKAKEAINQDLDDGMSWLILGNAYLTSFFAVGQDPKLLKQCMAAYQHAEKDLVANNNPDLHYNRAVAFKYEENYQLALDGFARAQQLDPFWTEPKVKEQELLDYLLKVHQLLQNKGLLKPKKFQSFIEHLKSSQKDLGPYSGGKYVGPGGKSITLNFISFSALEIGINLEKVVLGKVICSVSSNEPVPFTFCMVDAEGSCISVTIYNLANGQGVIIGDSVSIPEPHIENVEINHKGKACKYRNIRVDSPMVLVINGKKASLDKHAPAEVSLLALNR